MSFLLTGERKRSIKLTTGVPDLKFGSATDEVIGTKDFILCTAVQNNTVVSSRKVPVEDEVGATYQLNLAEEVNNKNITGESVTLEYDFLRSVAGSYKSVYVDTDGELYSREVVNRNGRLYKDTISDNNGDPLNEGDVTEGEDISSELLLQKRFTYELAGISPNRKEVKVRLKNSLENNTLYSDKFNDFKSDLSDTITYKTSHIIYTPSGDSSIIHGTDDYMIGSDSFTSFVDNAGSNEYEVFVNIPKFFVTAERKVEITTVTQELFQEPMPSFIPTMQQSQDSEFGQWTYFTDYTGDPDNNTSGWRQVGEGFDENGEYILTNTLSNGMSLDVAADIEKLAESTGLTITEPLIPAQPISTDNPPIIPLSASISGKNLIHSFRFSTAWINWFTDNASGKFYHPIYGSERPRSSGTGAGSLFEYIVEKYELTTVSVQGGQKGVDVDSLPEEGLNPDILSQCVVDLTSGYQYRDENTPSYYRDIEHVETTTEYEYAPFRAKLVNYNLLNNGLQDIGIPYDGPSDHVKNFSVGMSPDEYAGKYEINYDYLNANINEIELRSRKRNIHDLSYYALVGRSNLHLIVNKRAASNDLMLLKFFNPLPDNVRRGADIFFVREVMGHQSYDVNLQNFINPLQPYTVLRLPDGSGRDSTEEYVRPRSTEYQSYDDLLLTSSSLSSDIERDIVSGSINEVRLNIDYSNPVNFIKFSSARRRLENFKTKLSNLELYSAYSQSIAGTYYDTGYLGNAANTVIQNAGSDAKKWEVASSEVINSFDGYERYLYFDSASYASGSDGIFYESSWPKTNNTKPHSLYEVSSSQGIEWYNLNYTSASNYDRSNIDRLVYHFPDHIRDDIDNEDFLKFIDMAGHHFDNLKNYLDRFGQIYEIDESLNKGLSKQLVYTVAKSFGWNLQGGYDLAKLDKYFFGKSVDPVNKSTSIYASSSLEDISREVWKRIIANMPFFLKSKGTVGALRGLINCYGLPSTILRVREYGGPTITEVEPIYETSRKFSKALDFKTAQYVSGSWSHSLGLGGTQVPNTIEFRYKAASSSDQTLVQGGNGATGDQFGIYLKDNASADNIGRLSFSLSGSTGYVTASTEPLPFYNGDFWSVMLTKQVVSEELLVNNNFETSSLQLPFNVWQNGVGVIASGSNDVYNGNYSMKVTQNSPGNRTYSAPYRNSEGIVDAWGDARFITASRGDEFDFSVYAKVSGSVGAGATVRLAVFELDSEGKWINSSPVSYPNTIGATGGYHIIDKSIGKDWEKISFRPKLNNNKTSNISVQLSYTQPKEGPRHTVIFDNGSINRYFPSTESGNNVNYNLVAKQYDAGRDVIQYKSETTLYMPGDENAASQSYNTAYNNTGSLYIGGYTTKDFGGQFSGSMMEFRLWKSRLGMKSFDEHVENPQSFTGNSLSASFEDIALRYSFNESKNHNSDTSVRDTSTDQSTPISGIATGFADETSYSNVVDRTKFPLPKIGGIRTNANKVRIETAEYIDRIGENINLSPTERVEISSYDRSPHDSNRVGVYFSPIDVMNQDIINQLSDFNFDQYLGDPRDDDKQQYRDLESLKLEYFKKYTGANNFWDYLRVLNYFDHSLFNQLGSLLPARSKAVVGVLIEPNILERNKQPRNYPIFENTAFEETIKLREEDGGFISQSAENEYLDVIKNVTRLDREIDEDSTFDFNSENTYYQASITESILSKPSLRDFNRVDKFGWVGRNYMTSSITMGGPISAFTESIVTVHNQRLSTFNKKRLYIYSSKDEFLQGSASSVSFVTSSFEKLTEYSTGLRRLTFEGSKNTNKTALPSIDSNGNKTYDAVTYILTNPYTLVSDARESVQLRTEFDLGNENE